MKKIVKVFTKYDAKVVQQILVPTFPDMKPADLTDSVIINPSASLSTEHDTYKFEHSEPGLDGVQYAHYSLVDWDTYKVAKSHRRN